MFRHLSEGGAYPQPNSAKAAISIIKTVPTTANVRYTSLDEDGSTFIDLPLALLHGRALSRTRSNVGSTR
jgi:hypothetical protein